MGLLGAFLLLGAVACYKGNILCYTSKGDGFAIKKRGENLSPGVVNAYPHHEGVGNDKSFSNPKYNNGLPM
jgi:hypothetical protein